MTARGGSLELPKAKVIETHTERIEEGLMELRNSIEPSVSDFE